jgi:hypothetical protein
MKPSGSGVKRWLVRVIVAVVLLVAVAIGVCVYLGISTSLHAEKTLHAINLATVVVDRFIQQERRWPNSWDDLRCVQTVDAPSMYSWPDDIGTIQGFVTIDFDVDVKVIASQTVDDFDAIEPIGSYYPYKDYGFVGSLIESARTATSGQQSVPAESGIHAGTPSP